jgi:peptidoglycan/LPS O-acetylase OafA/YrhL
MASRTGTNQDFRPDVEGLRGLAVALVVLFHADLIGLAGGFIGVDVFFVISGFLITALLLREREATGRIGMLHFYARRARRLLPAAIVVLIATLAVALNVVAPLDRPGVGLDGAAAAVSLANVRFALAAGDYFSVLSTPSPFLHFWSLAVEEQFYLVWPAIILVVARHGRPRVRTGVALAAIVVGSFALGVIVTDVAANWAFYSLPTRAWELGLGGLLAVGSAKLERVPGRLVGIVGWLGLAAIAAAALAFDSTLPWPGAAAIVPVLGTVAVLAGGSAPLGPGRLLAVSPLRFLGKISYSLYLVHWPILVLGPFAVGAEFDVAGRAGLALLAIGAAVVSWACIETPFRRGLPSLNRAPRLTLSLGLSAMLAVVVVATPSFGATIAAGESPSGPLPTQGDELWPSEEPWPSDEPVAEDPTSPAPSPDPTLTPSDPASPSSTPTPAPAKPRDVATHGRLPADVQPALGLARADEERLRGDGCLAFERVVVPPDCAYGNAKGAFTVALVGDSHASHWFPAIERLARHEGWRVVTFVKVACPFIDMPVRNLALKREYRECASFNDATIDRLAQIKPDLTIVSMSRIAIRPVRVEDDTFAAKGAAFARMLRRLSGPVALIVDTPYAGQDVPACLSAHESKVDACAIPKATAFTDHLSGIERAAAAASGAKLINLTSRICIEDPCPVVVNGMIVFRDIGHLTATFSRSLAPALGAAIKRMTAASVESTITGAGGAR